MRRRVRSSRRGRPAKTVRYITQTASITSPMTLGTSERTYAYGLVYQANQSSLVRAVKVKNFTLKFCYDPTPTPWIWALIYWPPNAGTPASNNFQFGLGNPSQPIEFTDPPQNALMSGCMPPTANTVQTFHNRLARNLEPGASIWIVFANLYIPPNQAIVNFLVLANFALTF
jgi:hypothetical protein